MTETEPVFCEAEAEFDHDWWFDDDGNEFCAECGVKAAS